MKYFIATLIILQTFAACNEVKEPSTANRHNEPDSSRTKYSQVNFQIDLQTPTVGIRNYTLVSSDIARDSADAREIIKAKVLLPLAMQRHDARLFDSVLAKDFISQGEDEFFNRQEYINDRVKGTWMISDVQYENLVLEFFGEWALLTYANRVKEKDESGKENVFHWFWADIWVKENDRWKLKELRSLN